MEVVCEVMCLSHGRVQMRASSEILIDLPVTTMASCLKLEKRLCLSNGRLRGTDPLMSVVVAVTQSRLEK